MMKTWTLRLGMSLMVVVAFGANGLLAQEAVLIVPVVPYEPAHHPYVPAALSAPSRPAPASHGVQRALNSHGVGCGIVPFYPACGNLHYETRFIFGSCRSFFGESCPPNAHGKCAAKW